jgi:hypothetical protein
MLINVKRGEPKSTAGSSANAPVTHDQYTIADLCFQYAIAGRGAFPRAWVASLQRMGSG